MRMEVVVQRDGVPTGRVMFNMDPERQRMKEVTQEKPELNMMEVHG